MGETRNDAGGRGPEGRVGRATPRADQVRPRRPPAGWHGSPQFTARDWWADDEDEDCVLVRTAVLPLLRGEPPLQRGRLQTAGVLRDVLCHGHCHVLPCPAARRA